MDFISNAGFQELFPSEVDCIKRLIAFGALNGSIPCLSCGDALQLELTEQKKIFRCSKQQCARKEVSCRYGSVFMGSRLKVIEIMSIARCWLKGETHVMAAVSTRLNSKTISTWYNAFRELVSIDRENWAEKIGGRDVVVEIDETLLGRRKNHRGHFVEGAWVIVGIEQGGQRRAFSTVVDRRDANTIREVVRENVLERSTVYTDEWRGYLGLEEACNVEHRTVNHSRHFRDPETGICTNTVEGLNGALKRSIPQKFRNNRYAPQFVDQFIWKRKNRNTLSASFIQLLRNSLMTTMK